MCQRYIYSYIYILMDSFVRPSYERLLTVDWDSVWPKSKATSCGFRLSGTVWGPRHSGNICWIKLSGIWGCPDIQTTHLFGFTSVSVACSDYLGSIPWIRLSVMWRCLGNILWIRLPVMWECSDIWVASCGSGCL